MGEGTTCSEKGQETSEGWAQAHGDPEHFCALGKGECDLLSRGELGRIIRELRACGARELGRISH